MDWTELLGPVATGALAAFTAALPLVIPVMVALAGLGIALRVFGKFGIRR